MFNTSKPLLKSVTPHDLDFSIDCFVACFRIQPHNSDMFRSCLNSQAPVIYQVVMVMALYRIATQSQSPCVFWPKIDLVYCRSANLRSMFIEALNRAVSSNAAGANGPSNSSTNAVGHMPLKVTQSLQKMGQKMLKDRSGTKIEDEQTGYRQLLYWLLKLICTDPLLFLHVIKPLKIL